MAIRLLTALLALILGLPTPAVAQVIIDPPIPPCPWWHCGGPADVVIEKYRIDVTIEDGIAVTRVHQVLRNDSEFVGEGEFIHPIPADAAVTGLTLWIDGEPVDGELLSGEVARRTYEEIVRRTLDPALLEYAGDGLLRLSVFPIEPHHTRTVEIEYRQVLTAEVGLAQYRHPFGREHNAKIESVEAHIDIRSGDGIKTVYSPTHDVGIDRISEGRVAVGYEGTGTPTSDFTLYYSTNTAAVGLNLLTYREDGEGYFLLLASPGLAAAETVVPKDVVIVLDVSGSMEGEKFEQAQDAAGYVLGHLNPEDRFEVIAFSTGVDSYGGGLRPATGAGEAAVWVQSLAPGGSTNIDLALATAFDRAQAGRPTYVLFLTDGLPTEGVIDTPDILANLQERAAETVSIFAFGVGFDVDTFLLDAIARDHHGTSTYVTPDEAIDAAVETLYAKVASPVLTGVTVAVDGITVSDLHPTPLPDIFRGGQLVVAGRYQGSGGATITLSGRVRGETLHLVFDDLHFGTTGGDPTIPRLWATRKIGQLLTTIRLEGPDEETIDQIVRLSIRWGIVTPYTSYLVTADSPFGEDALDAISSEAYRAAAAAPAPTSGEEAVGAADAAGDLSAAESGDDPQADYGDLVRIGGGRTFRLSAGRWIDTTYDPEAPTVRIAFASADYFALAASDPTVAAALAVGAAVIVVHQGIAYEVVASGEPTDPLPDAVTSTTAAEPATVGPATTVAALPATGDAGDGGFPLGLVAMIGAALIAAGLLAAVRKP
jgi:Ca-activated chloride channel family protein